MCKTDVTLFHGKFFLPRAERDNVTMMCKDAELFDQDSVASEGPLLLVDEKSTAATW